ncbi:MAG: von Willebrand factor type A domain-containing protein, partial [Roseibacillus sp.]
KELRDSMADYDLAGEPADAPAGGRSVAPTREKLGFGYLGASFGRPGDEDEKRTKLGQDSIGNSLPGSALAANASGGKPKAADNGKFVPFASGDGQAEAQVRIDRELKNTTVNPTEVSNQVTEEVRYTVDQKKNALGNVVRPVDDYAVKVRDGRAVELLKNLEDQLRNTEEAARMANGRAQLNYRVDADGSVPLSVRGFGEDAGIEVREWDIPLYAWKKIQNGQAEVDGKLNASDLLAFKEEGDFVTEPKQALMAYGVTFPEGTLANYATSSGTFVAKNTPENLELIDSLVRGSLEQASREREALKQFEKNAGDEPYSTFSLNVSDVSFKLAKASLNQGEWPPAEQIRVEEFVNAFDYGDPAPNQEEKVACNLEQAAHPFLQQRNLLRVSMRTAALGRAANTPLRLTVLLDNSGSMDRADRVDSVKNAFHLLAGQLNAQDQVTLIGFARSPRLLADRVAGNKVAELANLVEATPSEGGTNIEQALELGITKAKEQMLEGGQNRIILLTDGAANLGNADPRDLAKLAENMRQQGISFDACGVGAEGLNDEILESLTRKGDGRYYFLDRPGDADAGFAKQIAGALRPAARNVKVQMNFNPNRVGRYRLYGFEKHLLKKEDFRNDSVDAAELAAEEAGNAIYQLELLPEGSGEIGTVSVRFQDTGSGRMIERIWTIPYEAQVPRLEDSAASIRLASGAALLGEKLKGSLIGEAVEMERLGKLINNLAGDFPSDDRVKELIQMANQVRELSN